MHRREGECKSFLRLLSLIPDCSIGQQSKIHDRFWDLPPTLPEANGTFCSILVLVQLSAHLRPKISAQLCQKEQLFFLREPTLPFEPTPTCRDWSDGQT